MQARRVRVTDVERLQHRMENVPEHRVEEVTTVQAIQMLASQIHAMKAKGYSLQAVAEMLSENGVTVSAKTLKTYLSHAKAPGGRKSSRKAKPRAGAGTVPEVTKAATGPKPEVQVHVAPRETQPPARVATKVAPPATVAASPAASTAATKGTPGTPRPGDEAGARRSAFVPKEDTRDI